ncbi:MAG: hypothetical protein OQL28_07705 [Sedimenticola sp.]|nr:hypothetical protein [Sedimenticola sp.]
MRYEYIRIILLWSLIATLPGVIFLVQVVILMPANMMFAYLVLGLWEGPNELGMVLFFGICFLVTLGIWAILATLLARLVCLVKKAPSRNLLLGIVVSALLLLLFLPVYGSGGHGPMRWVTAAGFEETRFDYWRQIFPATLLLTLAHLGYRRSMLRRPGGSSGELS